MYSYEDRIRAVELYIKLGKQVAEAIHQLGYPTENALQPRGYARTKPKYSQAQQTLAIEHYLAHELLHCSHHQDARLSVARLSACLDSGDASSVVLARRGAT